MTKLTSLSHGGGCGCKIEPGKLSALITHAYSNAEFPALLVGNKNNDDAAVWDLGNGSAMVNTVDFFMPVVDDPFDFGRIASANALSDVYAMGAQPVFANAILGWPVNTLDTALAVKVMEGAWEVCREAGIPVAGGHSIDSKEPFFGLSVNGIVEKNSIKKNSTAKAGDLIYLTKKLGVGIINTSIKKGLAQTEHIDEALKSMCRLNKEGALLGKLSGVHAMTDVTGFSLLGHLNEMCEGSALSAELYLKDIPVFDFLAGYLEAGCIPDATYRNWKHYEKNVSGLSDMNAFHVLNDPQTSGGLLIAVDPAASQQIVELLSAGGLSNFAKPIGKFLEKANFGIHVIA